MKRELLRKDLLDRFLRYVKVDTMSDEALAPTRHPSTDCQWDLLKMLVGELEELALDSVTLTETGQVLASLKSNCEKSGPTVAFMAHVDTAHDVMGNGVKPRVIESYDGGDITLPAGVVIPSDDPCLSEYVGTTIITSDGSTLLGADDKAGVSAIMSAIKTLKAHPEIPHPDLEFYFTTDEETGCGMDSFPYEKIAADICYTVDGGARYYIESECFDAWGVDVQIEGVSYHTGSGRGRIVNALTVASRLLCMLPQAESPEATDGRYGFYAPLQMNGGMDSARVQFIIRDFDAEKSERRVDVIRNICSALESAYPGCHITVEAKHQYSNMVEVARKHPESLSLVEKAGRELGFDIKHELIRGGTDGSRMAEEHGVPCPNLFTGGHNYHSVSEWAALEGMVDCTLLILKIAEGAAR